MILPMVGRVLPWIHCVMTGAVCTMLSVLRRFRGCGEHLPGLDQDPASAAVHSDFVSRNSYGCPNSGETPV